MGTHPLTTHTAVPNERVAFRVSELANILGFSRQGIYNLIHRGELRAVKISGVTIVLASDFEAFLQKCRG